MRRLLGGVLATLLVGVGALVAGIGTAPQAAAAACSGTSGVTVVVDFGGSTTVACAPGDPSSGLAALSAAGFSVTMVQKQPGFVCRISGVPSNQTCINTPPTTAYWSYWHAPRGGSWTYSTTGAGSYNPKPGTVEGWAFGSGSKPGTAPPAATKPKPKPSTTTTKPSTGGGSSSGRHGGSSSGSGSSGHAAGSGSTHAPRSGLGPSASPTTSGAARTPTPSGTSSGTPSATATAGATPTPGATSGTTDKATPIAAQPTSATVDGSGSRSGLVAGGVLVLLVAAAGTVLAVRRRRSA